MANIKCVPPFRISYIDLLIKERKDNKEVHYVKKPKKDYGKYYGNVVVQSQQ